MNTMNNYKAKVIAVMNQKGGVGKTTIVMNLGVGLARLGFRVLLIDADPQGSLTVSLGVKNHEELPVTLASIMNTVMDVHSRFISCGGTRSLLLVSTARAKSQAVYL